MSLREVNVWPELSNERKGMVESDQSQVYNSGILALAYFFDAGRDYCYHGSWQQ